MKQHSVVGKSVPRLEAPDKATGKALYGVDISLRGMLVGKILRSIHPHARIVSIDTSKAERLAGVKAVLTGATAPQMEREIMAMRPAAKGILATDRVRFIGDEIAAVAATDEEIAEEALDLIEVEYEELPAVFDPIEAMQPEAPKLHQDNNNVAAHFSVVRGDPQKAFKEADCIFEDRVATHHQHQFYLEPMCCVADVDSSGKLTLWVASMDPSGVRLALSQLLKMPESKVRVIQAYVGGAFGGKISVLPLYPLSALLAMKTGHPVMIAYNREEELIATLPRIGVVIDLKTGVKKDGTILVRDTQIVADNGAYLDRGPRIVAQMIVTPDALYKIQNVKVDAKVVYTNKTPVGAFRGFGGIHMFYALETHLDRVAKELGMDPMEIRLKNVSGPGYKSAHGWQITTNGISDCIREVAGRAGWKEKRGKQGPCRGLGMACTVYDCDARQAPGFGGSLAFVKLLEDGKVQVISGEADYGQGWNTIAAQIAAEELGLPYEDVYVTTPDTDFTPYSMGPWGIRVTVSGGTAVKLAAEDARRKLLELAADMLEASPADLEINERKVQVKGSPERAISVAEVAKKAIFSRGSGAPIMGQGLDDWPHTMPRDPVTQYGNTSRAYNFTAGAIEVEVNRDTGQVKVLKFVCAHDLGKAINPKAAEGQVEGCFMTGLGYATTEELVWEEGRVLNPNPVDYRVPTALDMPPIETILIETDDPNTPFGAKAVGQPPTIVTPPALANAIYDATGVRMWQLPITPDKVLKALEEKAGRV